MKTRDFIQWRQDTDKKLPNIFRAISISNFRRFKNLKLEDIPNGPLIIMGPNSSGKTSLLWAIIILLCAYNSKWNKSTHGNENKMDLNGASIASLMNYPSLEYSDFKQTFIREGDASTITGYFTDNVVLNCSIKANGVITLISDQPYPTVVEKIRFAYMGPVTSFVYPAKEVRSDTVEIYTSSVPNIRGRFWDLKHEYQNEITKLLIYLFRIKSILPQNKTVDIYLMEKDDTKIEIMHSGDALRKVFTTLVLFYTLVQCT